MITTTAIVSTYASSRFIRGCLEDLTGQTAFVKGELEIIVVVSGSPENEEEVVREYQERHKNLIYLRTQRESMYAAWNRGIRQASGRYVTNANTDDRHHPEAIERLARALDEDPGVALVYNDCYLSLEPNETYEQNAKRSLYRYPQFFAPAAVLHYQFGPQPMWRKEIHQQIGYFDGAIRNAGDYEFNLRFAKRFRAKHIGGTPLGLYLAHANALSFKDDTMRRETDKLMEQYRTAEEIEALYAAAGAPVASSQDRAQAHVDMGVRALHFYPPWFNGNAHSEPEFARSCFSRALEYLPQWEVAQNDLAVTHAMTGNLQEARRLLAEIKSGGETVRANVTEIERLIASGDQNGKLSIIPSGLSFPSQHDLVFNVGSGS